MKTEFRERVGELKATLREKVDASTDEKERVQEILRTPSPPFASDDRRAEETTRSSAPPR